jgi:hypothetical protein
MNKTFTLYFNIVFGKPMLYLGRDSYSLTCAFSDPDFYTKSNDKKYCFVNCGKNMGKFDSSYFCNTLSLDYLPYAENV